MGEKQTRLYFVMRDLNNVQVAEQSDESAGVQIQDYTMEFTAHVDISIGGSDDPFTYRLKSVGETWDLVANDGEFTF